MNRMVEPLSRSPFAPETSFGGSRNIPILPSSTASTALPPSDIMDITPPASASVPGANTSSPELEDGQNTNGSGGDPAANGQGEVTPTTNGTNGTALSAAAAASSQQPKVVQTAFIHKLYNMLEDQSIRHLISWSSSNESFVMQPSQDFSKVLAQYFKHTNISSFVRQLNMYGFHKVSDVFHTGAPDSTLWEFKHGNGSFKRGDLAGLREIKRRASRNVMNLKDSFASPHKPSVSQPGTPAEPVVETGDPRLANIEQHLYDMHARLMRTEESNTALSTKCAVLSDSLMRCQQWNNDLIQIVMKIIPDHESQVYRDLSVMHKETTHQNEMMRSIDDPHESLLSGRQPYFPNMAVDSIPLSPRQVALDERRPSAHAPPPRPGFFRTPAPPHLATSPRRYGSISNSSHSPSYHRPSANVQGPLPATQHPLASVSEPGPFSERRRHTYADIRDTAGWPPQQPGAPASPFEPVPPTTSTSNWPPSPRMRTPSHTDQQVRDTLASFAFNAPPRRESHAHSRQASPPPLLGTDPGLPPSAMGPHEPSGWSANRLAPRFLDSAPQTRRSSMASNVHSLLNPAETAEREADEGNDDRKRKRVQ